MLYRVVDCLLARLSEQDERVENILVGHADELTGIQQLNHELR